MKRGKKFVSSSFILLYLPKKNLPNNPPDYGIIASKKIGNSPQRNFVKRRFREIIRENNLLFEQFCILTIARNMAKTVKFSSLQAEFSKIAKIISQKP